MKNILLRTYNYWFSHRKREFISVLHQMTTPPTTPEGQKIRSRRSPPPAAAEHKAASDEATAVLVAAVPQGGAPVQPGTFLIRLHQAAAAAPLQN